MFCLWRPSLNWGPLTGVYGDEQYGNHHFRWLNSPAEIIVWAPQAMHVSLAGEWRCSFHAPETVLEPTVNGHALKPITLGQTLQRATWPEVPLEPGRNVIRFSSTAGGARISAQDSRVAAIGVQDLQLRQPPAGLQARDFLFLVGAAALAVVAARAIRITGLEGIDAAGIGILGAFGALGLSAWVLSAAHALTGTTWLVALAAIAAGLFLVRTKARTRVAGDRFSGVQLIWLMLPALVIGIMQFFTPVSKYDDLMYHGSRAGYWLGNHSVFPFPSHNERQEVFPYLGDLLFAFGVFTARSELIGRLIVFLAFPAVLGLVAGSLRERGLSAAASIGAAWLVGTAPLVGDAAIGIKPDLWCLVFALIAVNAAWRLVRAPAAVESPVLAVLLTGAICGAIAVKLTFLLLAPLAVIPWLVARSWRDRALIAGATLAWMLVFGLVTTLYHNKTQTGGWFGSPAMSAVHRPDPGVGAVRRHLTRLPFVLWGAPWVPGESLRSSLESKLVAIADQTGALAPLPLEKAEGWPGAFRPTVPEYDRGFSFFWVFAALGTIAALVNVRKIVSDRDGLAAIGTLLTGLWLMAGLVVSVRWQANSGIPSRLLVPGYAITVFGALWCWARIGPRRAYLSIAFAALLALHALPFLHEAGLFFPRLGPQGAPPVAADSVLSPAAAVVPPGSRILLFASQSSGDYVLFHPASGFPTRVVSWGRQPYSENAFAAALQNADADYVVFERSDSLGFHWHEPLPLAPFIQYLERSSRYTRMPDGAPNVIFRRNGS